MRNRLMTLLLTAALLASATLAAQPSDNVRAAIEAAGKQFTADVAKGNAAGLAAMYAADAQAFPPNANIVTGSDAIQKLWQDFLDMGIKEMSFKVLEVQSHGNFAHEVGEYWIKDAAGKEVDHGKYLVIWKREKGNWKIYRDFWNSSVPLPAPAPAAAK